MKGDAMLEFKKATKSQSKLRAALFGPSGSGKTYTALRVATGIGGKVAVIDTERGSASKYADRFQFDVLDLPDSRIDTYIMAMQSAAKAGYEVLIIDSLSHGWKDLLEEIDRLAKSKYKGNTWSAWSDGTPKQQRFIDALLQFPGHVLATIRSKTEWTTEDAGNGKSRPVRVGLAPEQGKGIEYEFDLLLELSTDHIATVLKDRTGKWQDQTIDKPGEDFGKALSDWLSDGEPIADPMEDSTSARESVMQALTEAGFSKDQVKQSVTDWLESLQVALFDKTTAAQRKAFVESITSGQVTPQKVEA